MTKQEFMQNNKYIRKALTSLDSKDLQYMQDLSEWKIKVDEKDIRLKQVLFHMSQNFKVWEIPWLIKSFKQLIYMND